MQDAREQGSDTNKGGQRNATDDGSILAIAWHNIAVEQEHLSMLDQALISVSERQECVCVYVCLYTLHGVGQEYACIHTHARTHI
jgi:hypothetical protein